VCKSVEKRKVCSSFLDTVFSTRVASDGSLSLYYDSGSGSIYLNVIWQGVKDRKKEREN